MDTTHPPDPPRPTDLEYLAALGVPVEDVAARAGVTELAVRVELHGTRAG